MNDRVGVALLDSGAKMPLIDYELLLQLVPNAHAILSKKLSKFKGIIGVTGHKQDINGVLAMHVELERQDVHTCFTS